MMRNKKCVERSSIEIKTQGSGAHGERGGREWIGREKVRWEGKKSSLKEEEH